MPHYTYGASEGEAASAPRPRMCSRAGRATVPHQARDLEGRLQPGDARLRQALSRQACVRA